MQDVDFSSAIQSAWLGWQHGCKIELNIHMHVYHTVILQHANARQDAITIARVHVITGTHLKLARSRAAANPPILMLKPSLLVRSVDSSASRSGS